MKIGKIERILHYTILIILAVLFVLPLFWMIFASVDPSAIQALKIPKELTMNNYKEVITDPSIIKSFLIGLMISGGQSIIVVLVSILAAYPLSRYQVKYKNHFYIRFYFLHHYQ